MAARAKKSRLRDARLQLGLSHGRGGRAAWRDRCRDRPHYETGVSKPPPDRAAQLAGRFLGLKSGDVAASERGSPGKTPLLLDR